MRWTGVTSISVLSTLGVSLALAGDPAAGLTDEDRGDLAWFEGLGYPKLGGLPFVEVWPGWDQGKFRGFLLSDADGRFRVTGLDLVDRDFVRTPSGSAADRRVTYEALDVETVAERWLDGGAGPGGEPTEFPWGTRASGRTEAFVFACAVHQSGRSMFSVTVHDLLAHARSMRPSRWHLEESSAKPLRERVAAELARFAHSGANELLVLEKDFVAARRRALDAHRAVARRFPGTPEAEKSKRLAAGLERQVREDEERAKAAAPADRRGEDERIRELVFRLRDQEANGPSTGGMGMIVDGPYRDLVALGHAAVPRLIEATTDESPSRCIVTDRAGRLTSTVAVGELAMSALREIAGRGFEPAEAVKIEPWDGAKWREACRPSIQAWWAEVQAGGEVASLVRVVEAGGYGCLEAAEMLAQKDAAAFDAAIAKGVRATKELDARSRLIGVAAKHPSDAVTALILDEMRTSPLLHPRVAAATALLPVRRDDAIAAMLGEWKLRREGKAPPPADDGSGSPIDETSPLVGFFVAAQDPAAIRALGEGLAKQPVQVRDETYGCLAQALGLGWSWIHAGWWQSTPLTDAGAVAAAEEVVALALDDATVIDQEVCGPSPAQIRGFDVRFADVAAAALAIRRGGGPTLAMSAERRARETALVANAWRKERGLAPIDVPAATEVPRAAEADIAPKLAWFAEKTHDWPATKAQLDAIEALGLPALAPLTEFLAAGNRGTWDRNLRDLAGKLAFHVRRVEVVAPGASLPDAFRARIESWRGRALAGAGLAAFAGDLIREAPPTLAAFVLIADRPGDGTGVIVTLRCTEGAPRRAGYWERVVSASRGTQDVGPHMSYGSVVMPVAADFIADGAERPFTAGPDERAYVRIDVR